MWAHLWVSSLAQAGRSASNLQMSLGRTSPTKEAPAKIVQMKTGQTEIVQVAFVPVRMIQRDSILPPFADSQMAVALLRFSEFRL